MPGTRALTVKHTFWDLECTAVVAYTESFFTQQLAGLANNLARCQKKLLDLEKALRRWREGKARGKRPTVSAVRKSVHAILSPQFMKELFAFHIQEHQGLPCLQYALDHNALDRLTRERLGRTVLVTDHRKWTAKDVIGAYRSLSRIEDAFKNMKNIDFLHWQPAYHWTSQKIRVHGFYCVLALLLATLARNTVANAGTDMTIPALLTQLNAMREVAVIYPKGVLAHPKDHITLSRMTPKQKKIADALHVAEVLQG